MIHARVPLAAMMLAMASPLASHGQSAPGGGQPPPPLAFNVEVDVVATTPLPGVELMIEQIPAPVHRLTASEIEDSGALNLADFLNRRLNGVHVNDVQGNAFQPDVNYRGFTASPLLGTPQGLSVYMDGVRLNQPFGETVSWDLIPQIAISSGAMMPGSNPIFGLNTLGGALSLQTKDGLSSEGTAVRALYGSHFRRAIEFETGGANSRRFNWYVAGSLFGEDGWREESPSAVRQVFGKIGWTPGPVDLNLTVAHADNSLAGNGLQEQTLLARDAASVYTKPDVTDNRSTLLNLALRRGRGTPMSFSGNAYYRRIDSRTLNGDLNEESLGQELYQPGPAERAALAGAGYPNVPASGLSAANSPFPFLRCLANVLLEDEPGEKCNGTINRTNTGQHNAGASGQVTWIQAAATRRNQLTAGGAFDYSRVAFLQSTEIGYLDPDRRVVGTGAFADGVNAGHVDGEPYDARVNLHGHLHTSSAFAADTLSLNNRWHLTVSGRFNRTVVTNRDGITPAGEPGSLAGRHVFRRLNPAAGLTYNATAGMNVYAGYSEGSRAATSIELGCADPERPCRLPNAMTGDPPLDQVVTRTLEAGVRGRAALGTTWHAGVFRADNRDDILFVASGQTGFGHFENFGQTRRQGLELGIGTNVGRVAIGAGYTHLNATFQTEDVVNGRGNSSNEEAEAGAPGLDGTIEIEPGDALPFTPRHILKVDLDVKVLRALSLSVDLIGVSRSFARGNENNRHQADGLYYLGPGESSGYAITNLGTRYKLTSSVEIFGRADNLFDRRYNTAAQLGANGFTAAGTFIARRFPAIDGEFPVQQSTFFAPGAPRLLTAGLHLSF